VRVPVGDHPDLIEKIRQDDLVEAVTMISKQKAHFSPPNDNKRFFFIDPESNSRRKHFSTPVSLL
jgi:hypothetical protein